MIAENVARLAKSDRPFWLAGGHAIDAFLRRSTREHDDLDFVIRRADQLSFQRALSTWDLQAAIPPGSSQLTPWPADLFYELPIHNVWGRETPESPWTIELLLSEFEGEEWVYRRNRAIRGPIAEFGFSSGAGFDIIAPEIQLLYKSRSQRPKDLFDLENCLSVFTPARKAKLAGWIATDSGHDHPWLEKI